MKKTFLSLFVASAVLAPAALAQRESTELFTGWRFIKQDLGVHGATDSSEAVILPHTWNAQDAQHGPAPGSDPKLGQRRGDYSRGACWYARELNIPEQWKGKRVFLLFVNGAPQGAQRGTDCVFRWPGVTLRPDENQVEARADFSGRLVTNSCTWVLDPVKAAPIPNP